MIAINYSQAYQLLKPLVIFIIGISIYSVFVFIFYRFLARENILKLDLRQYNRAKHRALKKFLGVTLYFFEYIIIFPIFILLWSAIITVLLLFMAKTKDVQNILLISMAVVGAIRVTSYYSEDLSKDLSKMLPFALLGIFLVDTSYLSFSQSVALFKDIPSFFSIIVYYFIFLVFLELILRILYTIRVFWVASENKDKEKTKELEEKGGVFIR